MKNFILLMTLLFSTQALSINSSLLGSSTEYTCIVEISFEYFHNPVQYKIFQTCDAEKTVLADQGTVTAHMSQATLQIEVIKSLREKGMHLVTRTAQPNNTVSLLFQKRDIQ